MLRQYPARLYHNIYPPRLRLTFGLLCLLPHYPLGRPHMLFLFVGTNFCFKLPSDSTLLLTPLLSASDSRQIGSLGTLTL